MDILELCENLKSDITAGNYKKNNYVDKKNKTIHYVDIYLEKKFTFIMALKNRSERALLSIKSIVNSDSIKLINIYGGGMIVTDNEKLASKVRMEIARSGSKSKIPFKKIVSALLEKIFLSTFISFPFLYLLAIPYWHKRIYGLYRKMQRLSAPRYPFTDVQAFIGLEKLRTLKERIAYRQEQAHLFKSLLNNKLMFQQIGNEILTNYYFFVALLPGSAWKTRKFLLMRGIDAGIGAEIADNCSSILESIDCHNTKIIFRQAIQLPLHEDLTKSNLHYIAGVLNKIF